MTHVTQEGEYVEAHAVVRADPIVMPAVSAEAALHAWEAYQQLKQRIAKPEDFQNIQGKDFPKKSLWRKLATFFNLTIEVVSEKEIKNEDGSIDFDIVYRAIATNGRSTIGDGSCNSQEKGRENSRHNTRSTAHTRAFNRAVSNLIGGGEVSAEEVETEDFRAREEHGHRAAAFPPASAPAPLPDYVYDPHYKIDLGTLKSGDPHWLNGLTILDASKKVNKTTKLYVLLETFDFYKKATYRNEKITKFLQQTEAYYKSVGASLVS